MTLFKKELKTERLSTPLLNTMGYLMAAGFLDELPPAEIKELIKHTYLVLRGSGDVIKMTAGSTLICNSLRFRGENAVLAFKQLF